MNTWGEVYNHHKAKGIDPADAAMRADEWEKRVKAAKANETPHCPTCRCRTSSARESL